MRGILPDRSCQVKFSRGELYHLHPPRAGRVGVGPDFRLVCKRSLPPPSPPSPSSPSSKVCHRPGTFSWFVVSSHSVAYFAALTIRNIGKFLISRKPFTEISSFDFFAMHYYTTVGFSPVGFECRRMPAKPALPAGLITLSGVAMLVTPIPADHDGAPIKTVLFDGILTTAAAQPPPLIRLGPHSIIFIFSSYFDPDACMTGCVQQNTLWY